jgi:hypothetical protein
LPKSIAEQLLLSNLSSRVRGNEVVGRKNNGGRVFVGMNLHGGIKHAPYRLPIRLPALQQIEEELLQFH